MERTLEDFEKHPNDFVEPFCDKYQLPKQLKGVKEGTGETAEMKMRSGRIGLFKVIAKQFNKDPEVYQRIWYFLFLGYKDEKK